MKKLLLIGLAFWASGGFAQTFPVNNLTVAGTAILSGPASFAAQAVFALSPTAPTPTFGDSSTKLATTAFVQAGLTAAFPNVPAAQLYGGTGTAGSVVAVKVPVYWAQSYGVKCDNTTNDTTALQNLINQIIASGGGTIQLPVGTCLIPGGLTENLSGYTGYEKPFVSFEGQGAVSTNLTANGLVGNALNIIGSTTSDVAYVNLQHLTIQGNATTGSTGLLTSDTAYLHLNDITIQGFTNAWVASDLEQSTVEHSNFVFNKNGILLNGVVNQTGSNSLSFYDVAIASNSSAGINVKDFNAVSFFNGSIQYNGVTAVSGTHGAFFQDTNGGNFCGYNTISFFGTIFEGNGGDYDLGMQSNYCPGAALSLVGVAFERTTSYATNNIRTDGTQAQSVVMSGSTFDYNSSYTPNGSRPNVNLSNNTASVIYDGGGNYYQSAAEGPLYPAAQTGSNPSGGWNTWTPNISCASGTFTNAGAAGRWKKLGQKTVTVQINLSVSNVGSCATLVNVSLPPGITVNSTGNIYPASVVDGTAANAGAGVIYFDSGVNVAQFYGTPAAHNYFMSATFETN